MTQLLLWAQSRELLFAFGSLVIIYILREIFLRLTIKSPLVYYVFLFPGVILHELSHFVFCLLTFAKIRDVKFFSKTGGFVEHQNSKIPYLGNFLISLAPFLVGSTAIYYLVGQLPTNFLEIFSSFRFVIIFYFLISVLITFFPSSKDILNSPLLYVFTAVMLAFATSRFNFEKLLNSFGLTAIGAIISLASGIIIFYMLSKILWKSR